MNDKFKTVKKFDINFYASRKQCDYPDCPWCARNFLYWYKGRIDQMSVPRKNETTSFSEAAATSIIPDAMLRTSHSLIDESQIHRDDGEVSQDKTDSAQEGSTKYEDDSSLQVDEEPS